jgi:hypothetical protein
MPDDAVSSFAELLASELEAAQLRWAQEITKVESEANANGRFHSGARIHQTAERLSEGIVLYRRCIFHKWTSYVRPRLPSLSVTDRAAFEAAALAALDQAIAGAVGQFEGRPKPGLQSSTDFAAPIKSIGQRERRGLENEIKLYVSTPTPASAGVSVVTHGSNSPVSVGSGSVHQQINTTEGMGELVVALTSLLDAMRQMQDHVQLNEVREIVVDAKDEAAKPVPNRLKLRSILAGVKVGVEGIATLETAWGAVHRVVQMIGLAS